MKGRKKGTEKTGGRQAGTPNRVTANTRQLVQEIIDKNLNKLNEDIQKLSPKDRINAITGLLAYVVPKMQATTTTLAIERLGDEQINELAEQILNGMSDEDNID